MFYKVKIKKLPKARFGRNVKTGQQMDGALAIQPTAMGGADIDQYIGEKPLKTVNTLRAIPREKANLEAEGGETAYGDLNGDGMAEHAKIVGPRHHSGGVPLNLPDDTFIFSDTRSMMIKDPDVLAKFDKSVGKGKKSKGYTPAQLAKQYDLNKYRKILQDPNSDSIDRKTAELMIENYTMKLGALALAQESKKGFPQGIPVVARPYMEANEISEEDIMPTYKSYAQAQQQGSEQEADEMYEDEQEGMPTQMPNGEEIAMSPEMMMQSQQPLAQYGMMMGGYDMPFAQDGMQMPVPTRPAWATSSKPRKSHLREVMTAKEQGYYDEPWFNMGMSDEGLRNYYDSFDREGNFIINQQPKGQIMAYGGLTKYQTKGQVKTKTLGAEELKAVQNKDIKTGKREGEGWVDIGDNVYGRGTIEGREWTGGSGKGGGGKFKGDLNAYVSAICNRMKKGDLKGLTVDQVINDVKAVYAKHSKIEDIRAQLAACQTLDQKVEFIKEEPTDTPCNPCPDGSVPPRTPDGRCPCEEKKCNTCPDGTVPEMTPDGKCPCGEETTEETTIQAPPQPAMTAAGWTAPDIRNYFGAFKDKYSLKPYYPWAARADLEEPTNILYDPTRELAQQSEQTNILTQGLGQFAGPQAMSSRASQIQGTAAQQAADTLSRYNNLNVGLENQFALTQNQIRNQEKMLNQATAKELYDKTMMTKQQMDNAKRQADSNIRNSFATGWKNASDIAMLNAMQEQYKVDPYSGTVFHTGVEKPFTPEKSSTFRDLLDDYRSAGYDPKDAIQAAKTEMSMARRGGQLRKGLQMKDGGIYVMGSNVFPFMFY